MALNLQNQYPGRFDPVSADYPQGKFKNRSSPTAQDGSYMERDWLNDWNGFFGAVLNNAGVTPNGNVDTAQSSQLFAALQAVILKSLPKRSFTANDFIRIPDVPGGLIIQWGAVPSIPAGGNVVVTYPIQYPNSFLSVAVTSGSSGVVNAVLASGGGNFKTSFQAFNNLAGAVSTGTGIFISIGF